MSDDNNLSTIEITVKNHANIIQSHAEKISTLQARANMTESHIDNLSRDISKIKDTLGKMSTKDDINIISQKLDILSKILPDALHAFPAKAVVYLVGGVLTIFGVISLLLIYARIH